jgi:hypothetical protein
MLCCRINENAHYVFEGKPRDDFYCLSASNKHNNYLKPQSTLFRAEPITSLTHLL